MQTLRASIGQPCVCRRNLPLPSSLDRRGAPPGAPFGKGTGRTAQARSGWRAATMAPSAPGPAQGPGGDMTAAAPRPGFNWWQLLCNLLVVCAIIAVIFVVGTAAATKVPKLFAALDMGSRAEWLVMVTSMCVFALNLVSRGNQAMQTLDALQQRTQRLEHTQEKFAHTQEKFAAKTDQKFEQLQQNFLQMQQQYISLIQAVTEQTTKIALIEQSVNHQSESVQQLATAVQHLQQQQATLTARLRGRPKQWSRR